MLVESLSRAPLMQHLC